MKKISHNCCTHTHTHKKENKQTNNTDTNFAKDVNFASTTNEYIKMQNKKQN